MYSYFQVIFKFIFIIRNFMQLTHLALFVQVCCNIINQSSYPQQKFYKIWQIFDPIACYIMHISLSNILLNDPMLKIQTFQRWLYRHPLLFIDSDQSNYLDALRRWLSKFDFVQNPQYRDWSNLGSVSKAFSRGAWDLCRISSISSRCMQFHVEQVPNTSKKENELALSNGNLEFIKGKIHKNLSKPVLKIKIKEF